MAYASATFLSPERDRTLGVAHDHAPSGYIATLSPGIHGVMTLDPSPAFAR